MHAVEYRQIQLDDPSFTPALALRYQVLRKPLNMPAGTEKNRLDQNSAHFVAEAQQQVVGCVSLFVENEQGKLYQMAVHPDFQKQGIGAGLVNALEQFAQTQQVPLVFMHAREVAMEFYCKLGYTAVGDVFDEIGIPHFRMEKRL